MKIGFVAEPYEEQHASGMGHVVMELLKHLPEVGSQHEFVFFSSRPLNKSSIPGSYTNILIPKGFIRQFFYFFFNKLGVDVLIFMVPLLPFIVRGTTIAMCQELGSQKITPEGFRANLEAFVRDRLLMQITLARASHIIAASGATRDDLLKYYNLSSKKVTVIYDGFQALKPSAAEVENSLKPYFFFAGKVKYRKNVHGIVSAFISFVERTKSDVKLIIAGDYGGEYYHKLANELKDHNLENRVHFVGYVSAGHMYAYYKNALACVFPSINEGFGMPIIESMSIGTPVITSNISSMAEVGGSAALLVDPFDVEDISQAMEKMYSDESLRAELISKGKERAQEFSWPKAARQYIEVASTIVT
jgi:glycosyltransferase involved in cell wall biosynthesis